MNNYRYVIAFCGSLFVYISFGALFFIISHYKNVVKIESQTTMVLDLTQFKQPQTIKPAKAIPEPPVKQDIIKPLEQKPITKEAIEPKKEIKPISKPVKNSLYKQEKLPTANTDTKPHPTASKQDLSQEPTPKKIDSGAFEAMVKNRIRQYKFYPPIAKNRGVEGVIEASFVILPNGNLSEISVSGPNALKGAAREAITRAFPIDVSSCPMSLPTTMHISLRYSLVSE